MKKEITIKRYRSGTVTEVTDHVASEKNIELVIGGVQALTVSMSPGDLEAFAYGFMLTSGLITGRSDVEGLTVKGTSIEIKLKPGIHPPEFNVLLPAGCGGGGLLDVELPRVAFREILEPDYDRLPELYKAFNSHSSIFEETGGVHSAALTDGESVMFFSEDIGRHNAVDKVIGKALLKDIDLEKHYLLTSGRISGEIVKKAFYAGLRAIISRSAPTCAAIVRARRANIGIIGFLRGSRFNVYR